MTDTVNDLVTELSATKLGKKVAEFVSCGSFEKDLDVIMSNSLSEEARRGMVRGCASFWLSLFSKHIPVPCPDERYWLSP